MRNAWRYLPAWEERAEALQQARSSALKEIKEQYAVDEDKRAALFELRALEKQDEVKSILREQVPTENTPWWTYFVEADAANPKQLVREPLDRSSVPATPDVLVGNGLGLQAFLSLGKGKALGHRNPARMPGQGPETGPAVMSMGRAIKMFGGQHLEREGDATIAVKVDKPKPWTELEYRSEKKSLVVADNTPEEQWAFFKSPGAFLADASRLARQYKKLVAAAAKFKAEKEAEERAAEPEFKDPAELSMAGLAISPSASEPAPKPAPAPSPEWSPKDGTWPPVTETVLEWNGFINWVSRCKQADTAFKRTLMAWFESRAKSKKAGELALKNWTPTDEFVKSTSHEPDQNAHYKGAQPLWVADGRELGWNISDS